MRNTAKQGTLGRNGPMAALIIMTLLFAAASMATAATCTISGTVTDTTSNVNFALAVGAP